MLLLNVVPIITQNYLAIVRFLSLRAAIRMDGKHFEHDKLGLVSGRSKPTLKCLTGATAQLPRLAPPDFFLLEIVKLPLDALIRKLINFVCWKSAPV